MFQELSKKVKTPTTTVYVEKGAISICLPIEKVEDMVIDGELIGVTLKLPYNNEVFVCKDDEILDNTHKAYGYEWTYKVIDEEDTVFYIGKQLE